MPTSLTLRLLSAARQTYAIDSDGAVAAAGAGTAPPDSGCIDYVIPPVGVTAGLFSQDAGFVGAIPEGLVVAIRGTTPPDPTEDARKVIIDWAGDAVALLSPAAGQPPGFPGRVHFGFYKSFMRLWEKLERLVSPLAEVYPQKRIFVTGHSKGAAICALAAWRLRLDHPDHEIVVRAFAPARVGDSAFAAAYDAAIPDHIRYEFDDDIVPHLPAELALVSVLGAPTVMAALLSNFIVGYRPVGRLGYIMADGSILPESAALDGQRVQRLIQKLATPDGPAYVAGCHAIGGPADGYVRASYPA